MIYDSQAGDTGQGTSSKDFGYASVSGFPNGFRLPVMTRPECSSDEFRMFVLKVTKCTKRHAHDWKSCPFTHPTENARRRDPRKIKYTSQPCPDYREGLCLLGDMCPYSHGVFESWLHPSKYHTQLCKDGRTCNRSICFFAHSLDELRAPSHTWTVAELLLEQQEEQLRQQQQQQQHKEQQRMQRRRRRQGSNAGAAGDEAGAEAQAATYNVENAGSGGYATDPSYPSNPTLPAEVAAAELSNQLELIQIGRGGRGGVSTKTAGSGGNAAGDAPLGLASLVSMNETPFGCAFAAASAAALSAEKEKIASLEARGGGDNVRDTVSFEVSSGNFSISKRNAASGGGDLAQDRSYPSSAPAVDGKGLTKSAAAPDAPEDNNDAAAATTAASPGAPSSAPIGSSRSSKTANGSRPRSKKGTGASNGSGGAGTVPNHKMPIPRMSNAFARRHGLDLKRPVQVQQFKQLLQYGQMTAEDGETNDTHPASMPHAEIQGNYQRSNMYQATPGQFQGISMQPSHYTTTTASAATGTHPVPVPVPFAPPFFGHAPPHYRSGQPISHLVSPSQQQQQNQAASDSSLVSPYMTPFPMYGNGVLVHTGVHNGTAPHGMAPVQSYYTPSERFGVAFQYPSLIGGYSAPPGAAGHPEGGASGTGPFASTFSY